MSDKPEPIVQEAHDELGLVARIHASQSSDSVVSTTLRTDQRVIARVTDGIYRQPASALRELVSNAYDADATRVVINTDAPRFQRISVEDDGHGMTPSVLANLLLHIGGSAKRNEIGSELGITDKTDPSKSPNGRILIGKIGIGVFSVSQLTHSFQIITKVKGDGFRTIATVALKQYSEDDHNSDLEPGEKFESGKVNIWRERAADTETHGTTIVLTSIRPQARDTLRSRDIWSAIEENDRSPLEDRRVLEPPKYHIGRVDSSGELLQASPSGSLANLPWDRLDSPSDAFKKLVNAVWAEIDKANPNPQLDRLFDYYLRMVWQISLSAPLPYVDGHIFDMDLAGWTTAFTLSNQPRGAAIPVDLRGAGSIRSKLKLTDPSDSVGRFQVIFDDLQLLRPIRFRGLPITKHAVKQPLVFIGKCHEDFPRLPRELSGGPLAFEAYLFWAPKIAPTEHQGSLVRIHGSSGTLFDPTFMRYQVSEQTRLRQITCEVFISDGLDSALNIDRESFNHAHPHSVYLTKWLHSALRQLATTQKRVAADARERVRDHQVGTTVSTIQQVALDTWTSQTGDVASRPPGVELTDSFASEIHAPDTYVFSRAAIVQDRLGRRTAAARAKNDILEEKLKAIAQVLASFGLLEALSAPQQQQLLKAIFDIIDAPDE